MLIYRFRVVSEENEEFVREIEIQPNQTFYDFHVCILESSELFPCEKAFFFLTDKKYKKNKEISLRRVKKQIKRYDPELDEMVLVTVTPKLMKDSRLNAYIEDPHQRMLYEYHGKELHIFMIELSRIIHSDMEGLYPKCTKWIGELPKKIEHPAPETIPVPEKPVIEIPSIVLPVLDELSKLDSIEEDEAAIAEIEGNLADFLQEEGKQEKAYHSPRSKKLPAYTEDEVDNTDEMETGTEPTQNYENIDNLEVRYSDYSEETEDE